MRFEATFFSREHRYSLCVEKYSGRRYAAIPVSNRMVDYVEHYRIAEDEYDVFLDDQPRAIAFIESCRRHEQDDRLFMQPGTDRGSPR